jgi:hypothetical protein
VGQEVTSVNAVGYKTVELASNFNLLSYNWNEIGGATQISVQDVVDTANLTKGKDPSTADNLLLWDRASQTYKTLYLYDADPTYPGWDGKWVVSETEMSSDMVNAGDGFWIKKQGAGVSVTVKGQVPDAASSTQAFPGGGFSLFGSAFSADLDLNADASVWAAGQQGKDPSTADNLLLWDKASQVYKTLYLYDADPTYPGWDGKWVVSETEMSDDVLAIGEGAWYKRADGTSQMNWQQAKPYSFPN